jgi:hypothetical protein
MVALKLVGVGGAVGVLLVATEKFQFAPPLLSQVPVPLLKQQFSAVAVLVTVTVACHQFDVELKVIAMSGETMME